MPRGVGPHCARFTTKTPAQQQRRWAAKRAEGVPSAIIYSASEFGWMDGGTRYICVYMSPNVVSCFFACMRHASSDKDGLRGEKRGWLLLGEPSACVPVRDLTPDVLQSSTKVTVVSDFFFLLSPPPPSSFLTANTIHRHILIDDPTETRPIVPQLPRPPFSSPYLSHTRPNDIGTVHFFPLWHILWLPCTLLSVYTPRPPRFTLSAFVYLLRLVLRSSPSLHAVLLCCALHSPMSDFDATF